MNLDNLSKDKKYLLSHYGLKLDDITDHKKLVRHMNFDD